jgi:hypothetical protein
MAADIMCAVSASTMSARKSLHVLPWSVVSGSLWRITSHVLLTGVQVGDYGVPPLAAPDLGPVLGAQLQRVPLV